MKKVILGLLVIATSSFAFAGMTAADVCAKGARVTQDDYKKLIENSEDLANKIVNNSLGGDVDVRDVQVTKDVTIISANVRVYSLDDDSKASVGFNFNVIGDLYCSPKASFGLE